MNKFFFFVLSLFLIALAIPLSFKVKDSVFSKASDTNSTQPASEEVMDNSDILSASSSAEAAKEAAPSASPSASTRIVDEKIEKTENGVKYEGTIKREDHESTTETNENGTKTVTNKNSINSKTNINIESDTGGNSGENVSNGDSNVSIKVKTNDDETTIDWP